MKRITIAISCVLALGAGMVLAGQASQPTGRQPIGLAVASTDNGNHILYRSWSDGSIDVRLVNPLRTQAADWPQSDRGGLSFQEGWKVFQVGR